MTQSERKTKFGRKGISSAVVKKMYENGRTKTEIAKLLGVSMPTVYHHLGNTPKAVKREVVAQPVAEVVNPVKLATPTSKVYEMNIFGTAIQVDRKPTAVTVTANKLIIK